MRCVSLVNDNGSGVTGVEEGNTTSWYYHIIESLPGIIVSNAIIRSSVRLV